jgi:hypothetical protein
MAEFRATVCQRGGAAAVDLHGQIDMAADGPPAARPRPRAWVGYAAAA